MDSNRRLLCLLDDLAARVEVLESGNTTLLDRIQKLERKAQSRVIRQMKPRRPPDLSPDRLDSAA
jgi:hypothetical protein